MMKRVCTRAALFTLAIAVGCGGQRPRTETPGWRDQAIAPGQFSEELRHFHSLAPDSSERLKLRPRLMATIADNAEPQIAAKDYEAVREQLLRAADLLRPEDFEEEHLPRPLLHIAEFIAVEGSRRGYEGDVLAARLILSHLRDGKEDLEEYKKIASWGNQARVHISNPLERYGALVSVWEDHAALAPAPSVLARLADLLALRQEAIGQLFESGHQQLSPRFGSQANRIWKLAPLDIAAVYLRYGDLASAEARVRAMGAGSEMELRLADLLSRAGGTGDASADAMADLVEAFRIARPDVAEGLCRSGLYRFSKDFRFPACLARIASEREEHADSIAWYRVAIELAPGVRDLYDEALARLNQFIETRLMDSHPTRARMLSERAEQILSARQQRWPDSEPPIEPSRLQFLIGMLEMNAGSSAEAKRRFEKSIELQEDPDALLQLGLLLERTGDPAAAERRYAQALDLSPDRNRAERLRRAEILEHLGDAALAAGKTKAATGHYKRALDMWTQALDQVDGPPLALLHIRRGVLFDSLSQHDRAAVEFLQAIEVAPQWREVYASILAHLVVTEPDLELAQTVWRRAQVQLTLAPQWKVYFTLWLNTVAARAGVAPDPESAQLMKRLALSPTWWGRLAKFGATELNYQQLLDSATNLGERTEAHFYEGTRLLGTDNPESANVQFQRVLDTTMVSFFEFEMARKLIAHPNK